VPPYGLRGQVVTLGGAPVANAAVELFGATEEAAMTETSSDSGGWFAFLVMNGTYRLEVTAAGFEIAPTSAEATVSGEDVNVPAFVATPVP
jgi:hypothetical protein